MSYKDKKTANFAKHNIHRLTDQPLYRERAYAQDQVNNVLRRLYNQYKTRERSVVAYKGGHVEKDLLDKLDIRNLGLPKYERLKQTIVEPFSNCGFHFNDNIYHCPMTE